MLLIIIYKLKWPVNPLSFEIAQYAFTFNRTRLHE
jgi:hypothetical protein